MIKAILKALSVGAKVAAENTKFPLATQPDTVVINTGGEDQTFTLTRSGGMHFTAMNDSCIFSFISEDAKKTVGFTIGGFSSIKGPGKIEMRERGNGTVTYCPDNRTEPVITYSSVKTNFIITEIDRVNNTMSGSFEASHFEETMDQADYKVSKRFSNIKGSFCKCRFKSM
jgi:hypothetical protein